MARYKVMRHDYTDEGEPVVTQCGGTVKTLPKANALRHRMRAQQPRGSSVWFTVNEA